MGAGWGCGAVSGGVVWTGAFFLRLLFRLKHHPRVGFFMWLSLHQ